MVFFAQIIMSSCKVNVGFRTMQKFLQIVYRLLFRLMKNPEEEIYCHLIFRSGQSFIFGSIDLQNAVLVVVARVLFLGVQICRMLYLWLLQELITQYRARILDLKQQSGVGPAPMAQISNLNDVKETIRQLEVENVGVTIAQQPR